VGYRSRQRATRPERVEETALSYRLEGFSLERLMHFATAREHDVVIEIRPHVAEGSARVMVVGAEVEIT
jgi:hypothetical protein